MLQQEQGEVIEAASLRVAPLEEQRQAAVQAVLAHTKATRRQASMRQASARQTPATAAGNADGAVTPGVTTSRGTAACSPTPVETSGRSNAPGNSAAEALPRSLAVPPPNSSTPAVTAESPASVAAARPGQGESGPSLSAVSGGSTAAGPSISTTSAASDDTAMADASSSLPAVAAATAAADAAVAMDAAQSAATAANDAEAAHGRAPGSCDAATAAQRGPTAAQTGSTAAQTAPTAAQTGFTAAQTAPTAAQTAPTAAQTGPTAAQTDPTAAQTAPTAAPEGTTGPTDGSTATAAGRGTGQSSIPLPAVHSGARVAAAAQEHAKAHAEAQKKAEAEVQVKWQEGLDEAAKVGLAAHSDNQVEHSWFLLCRICHATLMASNVPELSDTSACNCCLLHPFTVLETKCMSLCKSSRRASNPHDLLIADSNLACRDWSQSGRSPTPLQRLQTGAGAEI